MFGKEKNKNHPAPTGSMSTISNGMSINGDIISDSDLRVDGHIMGNVRCNAKIIIGESAIVDGDIEAQNADIYGTVNGNATTTELLCLKSNCVINGNIAVGRLDIEANALFNGKCTMNIPQQQQQQIKKPVLVIEDESVARAQQTLL